MASPAGPMTRCPPSIVRGMDITAAILEEHTNDRVAASTCSENQWSFGICCARANVCASLQQQQEKCCGTPPAGPMERRPLSGTTMIDCGTVVQE
eukprot:38414-Eustigmatos_ZCMA.PRE.1